eukprot:CAMPEP_0114285220 /NCGR_PEP_ID=MMETSP0059-20121206/5064_1 /TAXON_ID=36894 /ORGANISM="Pyramimonas parkeae, Strain CCMP726" /LENGTH=482 /DNA_ID=CAMNT_0001406091 /DNA_START=39 /DNA_END=1487 /DNA_ORIENTATION=-
MTIASTGPTTPAHKKARWEEMQEEAEPVDQDVKRLSNQFDDSGKVHDLMPLYYSRLFPTSDMYKWLAYGNDKKHPQADGGYFQRREFCFTLEGDIFVRYQSFKDGAEMHAALKDRVPEKIDIGPLYNVDPQRRAAYGAAGGAAVFAPVERELVFDVDMTDYDDVRTCCQGADICRSCWPLMTLAVKVLDRGLREDFGFENILWVYSGRRGVHCWVCDKRARQLTDEARTAVAEYFSVYKGGQQTKVALTSPLHPSLQQTLEQLKPFWLQTILPSQKILENPEHIKSILDMIPDQSVREDLAAKWSSPSARRSSNADESASRFHVLEEKLKQAASKAEKNQRNFKLAQALRRCSLEIMFLYTYPRLDVEVSKHMNHLLKAPFCVHPKTGRVCVPIDPEEAEDFDPLIVPTVAQLLNELDEHERKNGKSEGPRGEEHGKTSMGPYMESFQTSFLNGLQAQCKSDFLEKSKAAGAVAAVTGSMDW